MIKHTLKNVWPLFFGLGIMGLCTGAQSSLLGLRAELEGFDTRVTGMVMSAYYVGFLIGSLSAPKLILNVGHIRTFAALVALASIAVLVHSLIVDPWAWGAMRLFSGFAISAIYVVAESWLNQAANNRTRGQLLSIYMVTMLAGLSGGQFLLPLADPASYELFTLISVLISAAAIPILITATPMPPFEAAQSVSIRHLYRHAPIGVIGSFMINGCYAMLLSLGAVYASQQGMAIEEVSLFMAALVVGGMLFQWPLGKLSDHIDRRIVIAITATAGVAVAVASANNGVTDDGRHLLLALLFGGCSFPLLALYLALTHDQLDTNHSVGASGTLLLVGGIGATLGPVLVTLVMARWGAAGFFWSLAAMSGVMAAHALYRRLIDPLSDPSAQSAFQMQAPSPVGSVLMEASPADAEPPRDGKR